MLFQLRPIGSRSLIQSHKSHNINKKWLLKSNLSTTFDIYQGFKCALATYKSLASVVQWGWESETKQAKCSISTEALLMNGGGSQRDSSAQGIREKYEGPLLAERRQVGTSTETRESLELTPKPPLHHWGEARGIL